MAERALLSAYRPRGRLAGRHRQAPPLATRSRRSRARSALPLGEQRCSELALEDVRAVVAASNDRGGRSGRGRSDARRSGRWWSGRRRRSGRRTPLRRHGGRDAGRWHGRAASRNAVSCRRATRGGHSAGSRSTGGRPVSRSSTVRANAWCDRADPVRVLLDLHAGRNGPSGAAAGCRGGGGWTRDRVARRRAPQPPQEWAGEHPPRGRFRCWRPTSTRPAWLSTRSPSTTPGPRVVLLGGCGLQGRRRAERRLGRLGQELPLVEPRVQAAQLYELGVGALLDQATAVKDEDQVGGQDGGEPVRDH